MFENCPPNMNLFNVFSPKWINALLIALVPGIPLFAQDSLSQKMFGHNDLIDIDNESNKMVTSVVINHRSAWVVNHRSNLC